MHNDLEMLVRVKAELTSLLAALAVAIGRLAARETEIRLNREHIRLHAGLLERLTHNLKEFVCDRPDEEPESRSHI